MMRMDFKLFLCLIFLIFFLSACAESDILLIKTNTNATQNITANSVQCSGSDKLYNISISSDGVLGGLCGS